MCVYICIYICIVIMYNTANDITANDISPVHY